MLSKITMEKNLPIRPTLTYAASRTVGISSLGIEPVGLLDLIAGMLQGGIIVGSSYILITKTYTIQE